MKKLLSVLGPIVSMLVIIIVCINITAMLATAVVAGFFSALGLFLVLFNSTRAVGFMLKHSDVIDGLLFICGIIMTFTLGVTVGLSMVFFGVFITLGIKSTRAYIG